MCGIIGFFCKIRVFEQNVPVFTLLFHEIGVKPIKPGFWLFFAFLVILVLFADFRACNGLSSDIVLRLAYKASQWLVIRC